MWPYDGRCHPFYLTYGTSLRIANWRFPRLSKHTALAKDLATLFSSSKIESFLSLKIFKPYNFMKLRLILIKRLTLAFSSTVFKARTHVLSHLISYQSWKIHREYVPIYLQFMEASLDSQISDLYKILPIKCNSPILPWSLLVKHALPKTLSWIPCKCQHRKHTSYQDIVTTTSSQIPVWSKWRAQNSGSPHWMHIQTAVWLYTIKHILQKLYSSLLRDHQHISGSKPRRTSHESPAGKDMGESHGLCMGPAGLDLYCSAKIWQLIPAMEGSSWLLGQIQWKRKDDEIFYRTKK